MLFGIKRNLGNQRSASNRGQNLSVEKRKNILMLVEHRQNFDVLHHSASKEFWKINVQRRIDVKI